MKKYTKCAIFCGLLAGSVFAGNTGKLDTKFGVPSGATILPLAKGVKRVSALSAVDSITKGRSNMAFDSAAFTHSAQLNANNRSMVQGASVAQSGALAGSTTLSSNLLTGTNFLNFAKMASGNCGDVVKKMQTGAIATSNASTIGSASTIVNGAAGTFGNSTFVQEGTVLGANVVHGPVSGSIGTISAVGNPYVADI